MTSGGHPPAAPGGTGPRASPPPIVVHHLPRPYRPPPLRPSLPIGVAVLAVILAIGAVVLLLAGALVLLHQLLGPAVVPSTLFLTPTVDVWGAAILVVLGAALLALARALWDLERWSLYVAVGLSFLGLTYLFFTGSITVLFLLMLVIFIYLLAVRHHFY
jgi:hypothetical protein